VLSPLPETGVALRATEATFAGEILPARLTARHLIFSRACRVRIRSWLSAPGRTNASWPSFRHGIARSMPDRSRGTSRPYAGDVEATEMRGRGVAPPGAPAPQEPRRAVRDAASDGRVPRVRDRARATASTCRWPPTPPANRIGRHQAAASANMRSAPRAQRGNLQNSGAHTTTRPACPPPKNSVRGQVVDLSALIRRESWLDDHPPAPSASTPPVLVWRPSFAGLIASSGSGWPGSGPGGGNPS